MNLFVGSILIMLSLSSSAFAKPIVVLVPGFFNSLAPGNEHGPYFSRTIVQTVGLRARVFVVNNLSPLGGVAENSRRLIDFLSFIEKRFPGEPLSLITHSAGGLYALQAINTQPSLPIKTVVSLATPYEGIDFIENLGANVPGLESLAQFLRFDALSEFRFGRTGVLMKNLKVPSHVRWIALAGRQDSCFLLSCAESKRLSWVLSIAQQLMKSPSDGIVTMASALAKGSSLPMERWVDFEIPLEHWEMVEEASLFHLIGVVDTSHIRQMQADVYGQILDRIL